MIKDKILEDYILVIHTLNKDKIDSLIDIIMNNYPSIDAEEFIDMQIVQIFNELALKEGFVCTDGSFETLQYRKEVVKDKVYIFVEKRLVDPVNEIYEWYTSTMDITDYTIEEILNTVNGYYSMEEINYWLENGINTDLILECLFEQEI